MKFFMLLYSLVLIYILLFPWLLLWTPDCSGTTVRNELIRSAENCPPTAAAQLCLDDADCPTGEICCSKCDDKLFCAQAPEDDGGASDVPPADQPSGSECPTPSCDLPSAGSSYLWYCQSDEDCFSKTRCCPDGCSSANICQPISNEL